MLKPPEFFSMIRIETFKANRGSSPSNLPKVEHVCSDI